MPTATRFKCDVCDVEYATLKMATRCERQPQDKPAFAVGDVVLCKAGFGWYDGDRRWIQNAAKVDPRGIGKPIGITRPRARHGNCFGSCCTFQFYYIVTAVDKDPPRGLLPETQLVRHRWRYHLFTLAMTNGHGQGWTFDYHHYTPVRVKSPPAFIVKSGARLLGRKAGHLL